MLFGRHQPGRSRPPAARMGIPVFNAPFSNTRSVAELTIAEIVMLMRRIFPRSVSAHAGGWDKSAVGSNEVRGKTLGIVGYGNIGSQLAVLAEAMGMRVIYHDHTDKLRHGNVEPADSLDDLLARADVVTPACARDAGDARHDRRGRDRGDESGRLSSSTIRAARSSISMRSPPRCDLAACRGAAIDVFPVEPPSNAREVREPAAGPRQRHPDAARGRVDGGGPGAHRRARWPASSSSIPTSARPRAP